MSGLNCSTMVVKGVAAAGVILMCGLYAWGSNGSVADEISGLDDETMQMLADEAAQMVAEEETVAPVKVESTAEAAPEVRTTVPAEEFDARKIDATEIPEETQPIEAHADTSEDLAESRAEKKRIHQSSPAGPDRSDKYMKPTRTQRREYAQVLRQENDHLLITTGDTIFLTNSPTKNMQKNAKYYIYKYTKKKIPEAGRDDLEWYEEVGQVRILENHDKISIGRVIVARDIIHKGDIVFFGTQK